MTTKAALAAGFLALVLALFAGQVAAEIQTPGLSVLAAIERDGKIYFGGYLSKGYFRQPVLGVIDGRETKLLILPGFGVILNVKPALRGVVGFGFMLGDGWIPQAVAVVFNDDKSYTAYLVDANVSFYGVDGVALDGDELILAGYVYASRYAGDSDIVAARLSRGGSVKAQSCYGSIGYPDLPRRVLQSGGSIIIVGETWAYNVSQSDALVLMLDENLRAKASYAIGGAGAESPEDAVVVGGDLIVVGTTTLDGYSGFAVRVSEVGGLVWLRSFKGFGSTFLVSADYADGLLRVLGLTDVEEGFKAPVLLTLSERYGWSFELSRVEVFEVGNFTLTPVRFHKGTLFLRGDGSLFMVKDKTGRAWTTAPLGAIQLELLEHAQLRDSMERALYGWRSIPGIVGERPCSIFLSAKTIEPTVTTLKWREVSLMIATGEYKSKVELSDLVLRWLERNIPIILLSPALAFFATLVLATFRRKHSYPKPAHVYR